MKKITFLIHILITLFFISCSKEINTKSVLVTIKNNTIMINDTGFLYNQLEKHLEIFKLTQKILKLTSKKNTICINNSCYPKKEFNKIFFGDEYYKELIDDILSFKPIFNGKNLQQNNNCITQIIKTHKMDINYKLCDDFVSFKDYKYKNLIKIKILN